MDFESQELFPSLTTKPAKHAAIWQKRNMPGLELETESSIERLDISKENLIKKTLGPSISDICKSCMARNKVSLELSSNKRTGMVTLIIHGSPSDVLATKRELLSQLTIPKVVKMNIPSVAKPFVIGKGGSTLKRITTLSMTKILIPKKDLIEGKFVEIEITGDDQGIEMARNEIMEIVKKQLTNYRGKTMVQKFLFQFIYTQISALEKEKNVKIHVPPFHTMDDLNSSEEIVIVGDMDNVVSAVDQLNAQVDELSRSLGTIAVPLKKAQHRFIVGTKGKVKQEIFEKTGCIVIVPDASDSSETVSIRGPEHMLTMALQAVLEKANSVIIGTVDCKSLMPLSDSQVLLYLRYLFTREILLIKELQEQKSVNIHRQSALPTILEVHGRSRQELDAGLAALKTLITSHVYFLYPKIVHIPHEFHSYLIGKGGHNISKLKNHPQTHGRLLDIILSPDKEKSSEVGIILARDTNLEFKDSTQEADKMISVISAFILEETAAAANSRTEELFINSRFHGRLIGSGGSMMKELLEPFENSVKITFFSSKSLDSVKEKDKIVVRGNMDGVHQVSQKIQSMVTQWENVEKLTSFSHNIVAGNEIIQELFPGFNGTEKEVDYASFAWLVRDIRRIVREVPALQDEMKRDQFNIYSHRNYHLRLVVEPNGLQICGPKLIVPFAVDIIKSMIEKNSKTVVIEFSLLESESLSGEILLAPDAYNRVFGRLIGKDGRNIKKLGEKYNVHVAFLKPKCSDQLEVSEDKGSIVGRVSLKGFKEDVDAIRKELVEMFSKEMKKSYELVFDIPKITVGSLLSLGDFSSKKLNSAYSVFMKINQTLDKPENATIALEGEKVNCETVKSLILGKVDEMVNHTSLELRIPFYLHKHLIGPKGENINQIINSFHDGGKISLNFPRKSFLLVGTDVVTLNCHKDLAHSVKSKIDDLLSEILFPEGESVAISSLFSNGLESYISLSLKDFKRVGGHNANKFVDLTRKYEACVFIEKETPDSVTLRLVGKTKTASENLKQYLFEEKEETVYLDIPPMIYKNFDKSSSEHFFIKNLMSKLEIEFQAVFDINPALVRSGKVQVCCSKRNLSRLQMFFNSNLQKLGEGSVLSHICLPKETIARIIGKRGEKLKKIRQASGAWVDIYNDHESSQEIAVLFGPSLESVNVAELEIGKILQLFSNTSMEDKTVEPPVIRPQFPPGYSNNLKDNLRLPLTQKTSDAIGLIFDSRLSHFELNKDTYDQQDYNSSCDLDYSQTSTLCDSLKWHTIKGGKAVPGEETLVKNSKKKKKKNQKTGAQKVSLEPLFDCI